MMSWCSIVVLSEQPTTRSLWRSHKWWKNHELLLHGMPAWFLLMEMLSPVGFSVIACKEWVLCLILLLLEEKCCHVMARRLFLFFFFFSITWNANPVYWYWLKGKSHKKLFGVGECIGLNVILWSHFSWLSTLIADFYSMLFRALICKMVKNFGCSILWDLF